MVTHDPVAAAPAAGVVYLADGRIAAAARRLGADAVAATVARLGEEGA